MRRLIESSLLNSLGTMACSAVTIKIPFIHRYFRLASSSVLPFPKIANYIRFTDHLITVSKQPKEKYPLTYAHYQIDENGPLKNLTQ